MPKPKIPAPKKITLRKTPAPTRPPDNPPLFRMRHGSPSQMERVDGTKPTERSFNTEKAAKEAAIKVFADYKPLMERINPDGLVEIGHAIDEIQALPVLLVYERRAVERCIDSYSGTVVRVELWKVKQ